LIKLALIIEVISNFSPIVIDSTTVTVEDNVVKDLPIEKEHYYLSNSIQGSAEGLNFINH